MGGVPSRCCTPCPERSELRAKVQALEEEVKEMRRAREREARACEHHAAVFASREEEWKRERRKHREEAARLTRRLKEEEERMRGLEEAVEASRGPKEWPPPADASNCLVEHMKEEQARREEAVEKWKQLYHAIKTELDDLILRTRQGERFCLGMEEGIIEGLQRELKAKEEAAETLRSRVAAMEKEAAKRDREMDIMRQSLRILSCTKRNRIRKHLPRSLRCVK